MTKVGCRVQITSSDDAPQGARGTVTLIDDHGIELDLHSRIRVRLVYGKDQWRVLSVTYFILGDLQDFYALVSGETVRVTSDGVEAHILLTDVDFHEMRRAIDLAKG